jgi:CheY-like chemotaxis protein/REP element-mobilizing transposase RayT
MSKSILVASPDMAFGELLRSSLMEAGEYSVQYVKTGTDVLASISSLVFDLAFLDGEIQDQPLGLLIDAMRIKLPDIKVVVVPLADEENFPSAQELGADAFIKKPPYLPDLITITVGLLSGGSIKSSAEPKPDLPFDDIVLPVTELAAQENLQEKDELVKWFSESSALAAVIIKGKQLIASAGEINDAALHNLIDEVQGYITPGSREELIRFSSLGTGGQDRLVYAAHLTPELTGVLVYEVSTLFSSARTESATLAQALVKASTPVSPGDQIGSTWTPEAQEALSAEGNLNTEEKTSSEAKPDEIVEKIPEGAQQPIIAKEVFPSTGPLPELIEKNATDGDGEIPFPWQASEKPVEETKIETDREPGLPSEFVQEIGRSSDSVSGSIPPSIPVGIESTFPAEVGLPIQTEPAETPSLEKTDSSSADDLIAEIAPERPDLAKTAELESLKSHPLQDVVQQTFVLVPGDPKTFLVGELADDVAKWIPEICAAHRWQLNAIAIRPVYMQLSIEVPNSLLSTETVKILRNDSSNYIFLKNPSWRSAEAERDFWAEEHLEVDPEKPINQHDLRIFINRMHG